MLTSDPSDIMKFDMKKVRSQWVHTMLESLWPLGKREPLFLSFSRIHCSMCPGRSGSGRNGKQTSPQPNRWHLLVLLEPLAVLVTHHFLIVVSHTVWWNMAYWGMPYWLGLQYEVSHAILVWIALCHTGMGHCMPY